MIQRRYLYSAAGFLIAIGLLFLCSVGAFLYYVPLLPLAAVSVTLMALIVMFALGLYVGTNRRLARHDGKILFDSISRKRGPAMHHAGFGH